VARALAIALLLCTGLALHGCRKTAVVHLRLPDFGEIGGVWLWRQGANGYERHVRYVFQGITVQSGTEVLQYTVEAPDVPLAEWSGVVESDPYVADAVQVRLVLPVDPSPALWRATSWNGFGESELSAEARSY
jgi:hypothetical protein